MARLCSGSDCSLAAQETLGRGADRRPARTVNARSLDAAWRARALVCPRVGGARRRGLMRAASSLPLFATKLLPTTVTGCRQCTRRESEPDDSDRFRRGRATRSLLRRAEREGGLHATSGGMGRWAFSVCASGVTGALGGKPSGARRRWCQCVLIQWRARGAAARAKSRSSRRERERPIPLLARARDHAAQHRAVRVHQVPLRVVVCDLLRCFLAQSALW